MTEEEFFTLIGTRLAENLVEGDLELKNKRYAFNTAKTVMKQYGNIDYNRKLMFLQAQSNTNEYTLNIKPEGLSTFGNIEEDPVAMGLFRDTVGTFSTYHKSSMIEYTISRSELESWKDLFGTDDIPFRYNPYTKKLQVYDQNVGDKMILDVIKEPADDEYRQMWFIQEWTFAECMTQLGIAYRRLGSVAGPDGSQVTLDGPQLIEQGRELKNQLREDIKNSVDGWDDSAPIISG